MVSPPGNNINSQKESIEVLKTKFNSIVISVERVIWLTVCHEWPHIPYQVLSVH